MPAELRVRYRWLSKGSLLLAWMLALAVFGASAARAQTFQTSAPFAILVDVGSGTVLYEKNADQPMIPASMAKIMTAEVLFNEIRKGRIKLDDEFFISENAWRSGGAMSGGSAMFAQVGTNIKVIDLIQGIAIQSGNDAAIAVAEGIAGTEANFARMMTERARELGLSNSVFTNSTGIEDPNQHTTARDLAKLTIHLIETYPDLYKYFGEPEFTWNKIRQVNRNPLLTMNIGADGVKTGHLKDSGYGLVGSAVQNGQRLVVVVNGLKTPRDRAQEARKLLDWGFRAFEVRQLFGAGETVAEASVFGGAKGSVPLISTKPVSVLVPRGSGDKLSAKVVYSGPLLPPVDKGVSVARLRVVRGDQQVLDVPLITGEEVARGSLSRRALDAVLEIGTGFIRDAFAKTKL